MRLTKIQIINLACFHLGNTRPIVNLDDENSVASIAANLNYENALETILRSSRWHFARKVESLELHSEDNQGQWRYVYRYPADCVDLIRISNGTSFDTDETMIEFKIEHRHNTTVILSNHPEARAEYTFNITNTSLYPADFTQALSFLLAYMMAPAITNGDPLGLGEKMYQRYNLALKRAHANSMNESSRMFNPTTPSIRARGM